MKINAYLEFNGQCEAAFKFYEHLLAGTIVMMMKHGDSPMVEHTPDEQKDFILHARLTVGDNVLMGSDCPPDLYTEPKGFSVSLLVDSDEEANRIYNALSDGASITMPIQETFWASRFAMLTDRFGTRWMINCERAF